MNTAIIIILFLMASLAISITQRKKYPYPTNIGFEKVPEKFRVEVKKQQKDGYKLSSVSEECITMVKRRQFIFPWAFIFLFSMPINIAFNTWYQAGLYVIKVKQVENEIEISTL